MDATFVTATVHRVVQLSNTPNGNRRFKLVTSAGNYNTAANHAFVQTISWDSLPGKRVVMELSSRLTIQDLTVSGFDPDFQLP